MKKKARALLLALALCLLVPLPASANGVEPPYLTILVENPPADLQLTLTVVDETSQEEHVLSHDTRLWERYFRFYSHIWSPWAPEGSPQATATLLVETGGESRRIRGGGQPMQLVPGRRAAGRSAPVNLLFGTSTLLTIQNAPPGGYARWGVPIFLARERRAKGFPPRNPVAAGRPRQLARAVKTALATLPAVSMPPAPSSTTTAKA